MPAQDISLNVGELEFPASMLDQLRKLGLTVELDDGKIMLKSQFTVASNGVALSPEQAKLLVHMKIPLVRFKIDLLCAWHDGEFQEL